MSWLMVPMLLLAVPSELLVNGTFDGAGQGWVVEAPTDWVDWEGGAVRIDVPASASPGYPRICQDVAGVPGALYEAQAVARAEGTHGGYGVYTSIEFLDAGGRRISFRQSSPALRSQSDSVLSVRAQAPADTAKVRLCLVVHGAGEGRFASASLTVLAAAEGAPAEGPVTLRVEAGTVAAPFLGFGFEDDGWFFNPDNAAQGVDEADADLRARRIAYMAPDWVRMFFWYKDWCPTGDWETFTFDSPNMDSHYRSLAVYQALGVPVNVTGVEWGMEQPYADVAAVARAIGVLLEHLVRDKGFTCIRAWTLTNEPNTGFERMGTDFDGYVRLHQLVGDEIRQRGLAIQIVGSDDTDGLTWFRACVENPEYFDTADVFASHLYLPHDGRGLTPYFFRDRLEVLASRKPVKPFVVAEFGFQDARSGTMENPLMDSYDYALWTAAFCIEGLNAGVSGFAIWCLHEIYYPGGGRMNYGLWAFKDRGWALRPVYYAWADFCRLTQRGDTVQAVISTHGARVQGTVVGDTLFWVNEGPTAVEVRVEGASLADVRAHTAHTLFGERDAGMAIAVRSGAFRVPARSFGYGRLADHAGASTK